ncbi:organic solvent tolerance protein, putative [Oceanicola granulosus HTCC2516]|uniref:LPS-assembly protein LptD n=1 Tax=Oceanicola granulosus (strain ATCC BAA-861 / DSM 15982 / KCTC 12143 / HTCC2516) TaxID=314256 RepID=Q2CC14_OCEGH|nr:LPS assembly protein LptD [Oceanicola granulosus]EAR50180.1 organic solvent tolerance protein, putative [Oceanicola granulosus HTCC2516]
MRALLLLWLTLTLTLTMGLLAAPARAQIPATLVADSVTVTPERQLIARGNVEAFYEDTRLSAEAIVYDEASDRLTITGPIFIQTADGDIFTAERANLDPRLENGLLIGARLVLNEQLQLAANQIDRVDGRLTQLYKVAATACRVCGGGPPLWEIRARRVIHDEAAGQLYFEAAQFRIGGVPVFYLPRMRLPDPTNARSTGLLIPRLRTTDRLGTGIKLPYFITLGPHADLTLTPYLSPATRTLEARFRRAFLRGDVEIDAAVTSDDILDGGKTRDYVFAEAEFAWPGNWRLEAQLQAVSDQAYLIDYDYSDTDLLTSFLRLGRITEDSRLGFDLTVVESLRDGDENELLPTLLPSAVYERVLRYPGLPGALTAYAEAEVAVRTSERDRVGRDIVRLGTGLGWRHQSVLPGGLLAVSAAGVEVDRYRIDEDSAFPDHVTRRTPYLQAELRWPLARTTATGSTHVLEPVLALTWSDTYGGRVPNEDSQVVELDETNLFALSRFPGEDAREDGWRAAAALSWTVARPSGWQARTTVGRLLRASPDPRFASGTGLDGDTSDWVAVVGLDTPTGLSLDARALFDDDYDFARTEARLDWSNARFDLAATYVELAANEAEARPAAVAEWTFDADYRVSEMWEVSAEARYDIAADAPKFAGVGVEYTNECVTVGLSVSRRFTSSTTLEPETDYGLSVGLNGFSAGRQGTPVRSCRN